MSKFWPDQHLAKWLFNQERYLTEPTLRCSVTFSQNPCLIKNKTKNCAGFVYLFLVHWNTQMQKAFQFFLQVTAKTKREKYRATLSLYKRSPLDRFMLSDYKNYGQLKQTNKIHPIIISSTKIMDSWNRPTKYIQ